MTDRQFWIGLIVTSALAGLLTAGLHLFPRLSADWPLSIISVALFFLLSVLVFFLGRRTARSDNKFAFNNLVMGVTISKMFLSGGVIAAYALLAKPTDKIFVLPFFLIYLLFTAYEVYVLMKMARETAVPKA
ncbi:MAG: hypothetical protein AAF828_03415 [Bacteroidota bacterium]